MFSAGIIIAKIILGYTYIVGFAITWLYHRSDSITFTEAIFRCIFWPLIVLFYVIKRIITKYGQ